MSAVGEWAFPLLGTESDYLKAFFKYQYFHPLLTRLNFSATARVGLGAAGSPSREVLPAGATSRSAGEDRRARPEGPGYGHARRRQGDGPA
jgi:hypothetical protein